MTAVAFDTYRVLGIPISATSLDAASCLIHQWGQDNQSRFIFIRDVHGVMQAQDHDELRTLHDQAAMVTPDGMPLVWLGKLAGKSVSRTCGPDLMARVLEDSGATGLKHYFYGGKPGVAEALKTHFTARVPGLQVVGVGTPPFRPLSPEELKAEADAMNASDAQVIWIGISTPKQEFLMRDLAPLVSATLIGVGAAFDFHTGAVSRSPRWMRPLGLEWLWRLASEPRRLWRRYLVMAPRFVWLVMTGSQKHA